MKKMGFLGGFTRHGELHPGLGKSKSIISSRKGILEDDPLGFWWGGGDVPFVFLGAITSIRKTS